jgi:hypothetical protein
MIRATGQVDRIGLATARRRGLRVMLMRLALGRVARFSIFAITLSDAEAQGLTLAEPPFWRYPPTGRISMVSRMNA